jgi:hypothetical protein
MRPGPGNAWTHFRLFIGRVGREEGKRPNSKKLRLLQQLLVKERVPTHRFFRHENYVTILPHKVFVTLEARLKSCAGASNIAAPINSATNEPEEIVYV